MWLSALAKNILLFHTFDGINSITFPIPNSASPFADGGHVLCSVHERNDGHQRHPSLPDAVGDGNEHEVRAAFSRHPFVG